MPERTRIFSRCNTNASTWTVKLGSTYRFVQKGWPDSSSPTRKTGPISISKPLQETELRKLPLESLQAAESIFCCVGWPWKRPEMDILHAITKTKFSDSLENVHLDQEALKSTTLWTDSCTLKWDSQVHLEVMKQHLSQHPFFPLIQSPQMWPNVQLCVHKCCSLYVCVPELLLCNSFWNGF